MLTQRKPWDNTSKWLYAPSDKFGGKDVFLFILSFNFPSISWPQATEASSLLAGQSEFSFFAHYFFFLLAVLPFKQPDKSYVSPAAPYCLQRSVGSFYQRRDRGESSAGFWKSDLGGSSLIVYACSQEPRFKVGSLQRFHHSAGGCSPRLRVPAEIPLLKGHNIRKLVSFQDATPERAFYHIRLVPTVKGRRRRPTWKRYLSFACHLGKSSTSLLPPHSHHTNEGQ